MIFILSTVGLTLAGPVYDSPALTVTGAKWSNFGGRVAGVGDVNGDGYDDLAVSASYANSSHGEIYLYHGSEEGITTVATTLSEADEWYFSINIIGAGDINGDGYADVAVAGYHANSPPAYVYYGGADGLGTTATVVNDTSYAEYYDSPTLAAGDFDGDGFNDLATGYRQQFSGAGELYLYSGSDAGLLTTPTLTLRGTDRDDQLGIGVNAGDINSDGYADLLVITDTNFGQAHLYFGGSTGLDTSAPVTFYPSPRSYLGNNSGIGDFNCDGYPDIALGEHDYETELSSIHIYYGHSEGVSDTPEIIDESEPGEYIGAYLTAAGDGNGDGCDELLTGSPYLDDSAGRVWLYAGSPDGLIHERFELTFTGPKGNAWFGRALVGVGDLNGDGYGEVSVSSNNKTSTGSIHLYQGDADEDGDGVLFDDDCNDNDPSISRTEVPDVPELCDAADNDCDGVVDEDSDEALTWYLDADGDGFGDPTSTADACEAPEDYVSDNTDCDDSDLATHPGATEIPGDQIDQDCDGEDLAEESTEDTGEPPQDTELPEEDTAVPEDTDTPQETDKSGCGCASTTPGGSAWFLALAAVTLVRRRHTNRQALLDRVG